jgi:hypothetical protein
MSVVDPSVSCCPLCRPIDCSNVKCATPICPTGFHAEVPMGGCCPTCVMGVSMQCNGAQAAYGAQRSALLEKYSAPSCMVDSDCTLVYESNACVSNCGEALPVATASSFTMNLMTLAGACDMACPPKAAPPCALLTAACSNGKCTTVPGLHP